MTHIPHKRAVKRFEALSGIAGGKPSCLCCGISDWRFLTFDHIHGGGRAERAAYNGANILHIVTSQYNKNGYWARDKYQVLCNNCNQAKQSYGVCPHQTGSKMNEITKGMLGTYVRALLAIVTATVLGAYLDSGKDIFSVTLDDWKTYAAAGIAAAVPVLIRWLNINDTAYGLVKATEED